MIDIYNDEFFMKQALLEAKKAFDKDEVPVGAVVVLKNRIIARGHNLTEQLSDVTAHAEVQAITSAAQFLGSKYWSSNIKVYTFNSLILNQNLSLLIPIIYAHQNRSTSAYSTFKSQFD